MELHTDKRIEYIDALRGFIMVLVVYHHIAYWCLDNIEFGYNETFRKFLMPTFFFISGFLFYNSNSIREKGRICYILKKKFMRLIIPFLFFMLLYMYLFNAPEYHTTFDSKYGFWYIFTLFQYYIIYIGIEVLFNKNASNKKDIGVMLIMLALSILAFYYEQLRYSIDLGIWKKILTVLSFAKIKFIFFFWLGTFVKKNLASYIRISENAYVIAICLCLFFLLAIHSRQIYHSNLELRVISFLLSGTTGIIILFSFFRKNKIHFSKNKRIGKALQYIGKRTLDIYLLHYFVLPYHMYQISTWLSEYSNKTFDMLIMIPLTLWVVSVSLVLSKIIRFSPFLGHYLFGVDKAITPDKTDLKPQTS